MVGNLFGEMFAVLDYSLVLLLFGFAIGVRFAENPVIGSLGLLALTLLFGIGFASVSIAVALATGSVRATQSTFIIFFPLLFLTPSAAAGPDDRLVRDGGEPEPHDLCGRGGPQLLGEFNAEVIKGFLAAALFSA